MKKEMSSAKKLKTVAAWELDLKQRVERGEWRQQLFMINFVAPLYLLNHVQIFIKTGHLMLYYALGTIFHNFT